MWSQGPTEPGHWKRSCSSWHHVLYTSKLHDLHAQAMTTRWIMAATFLVHEIIVSEPPAVWHRDLCLELLAVLATSSVEEGCKQKCIPSSDSSSGLVLNEV
jgi:hypothetical protein